MRGGGLGCHKQRVLRSRRGARLHQMLKMCLECPDVMSEIEDLHPLLRDEKQHVQDGLTGSKTELMI